MDKRLVAALALLGPVVSVNAYAEIYMSEADAASSIFPGAKFERREVELTPEQIAKIESASDQKVRSPKLKVFVTPDKNVVFVDQVLGKHEFITFAVGLTADGKVAGMQVIEYRESYGQAVRKPEWRDQFKTKDASSPLKVGKDIKNISGATLSSSHLTDGVRRIVQTYGIIKPQI